jgi:hypothetical protein
MGRAHDPNRIVGFNAQMLQGVAGTNDKWLGVRDDFRTWFVESGLEFVEQSDQQSLDRSVC